MDCGLFTLDGTARSATQWQSTQACVQGCRQGVYGYKKEGKAGRQRFQPFEGEGRKERSERSGIVCAVGMLGRLDGT